MSEDLVSMWVFEKDRDIIKVEAAKDKKTMAELIHELVTQAFVA